MAVGCQLYVIVEAGATARDRLAAALGQVPVASVLIRPQSGKALDAQAAKALVDLAQSKGVAALIEDDARLARTLRADGVHLKATADLEHRFGEARDLLGQGAIVGVDVGGSRHLAMELGEAGADYVGFGASRALAETEGEDALHDAAATMSPLALIDWWSEIFEVPAVAFDGENVHAFAAQAAAGADFVAVAMTPGQDLSAAVDGLREAAAAIQASPAGAGS